MGAKARSRLTSVLDAVSEDGVNTSTPSRGHRQRRPASQAAIEAPKPLDPEYAEQGDRVGLTDLHLAADLQVHVLADPAQRIPGEQRRTVAE